MSYIRLEKDADGIVELIFDQPGKEVNVMGDEYAEAMPKALDELEAMKDQMASFYAQTGVTTHELLEMGSSLKHTDKQARMDQLFILVRNIGFARLKETVHTTLLITKRIEQNLQPHSRTLVSAQLSPYPAVFRGWETM